MVSEKPDFVALQEDLKRQHGIAMDDLDEFSTFLSAWQAVTEDSGGFKFGF